MALIKVIKIGDELVFDFRNIALDAKKEISLMLVPIDEVKMHVARYFKRDISKLQEDGKAAVFKIMAHPSIPVKHFRMKVIQNVGNPDK